MHIEESYYTIVKTEDTEDCFYGPCTLYYFRDGCAAKGKAVEIGLYLDTPDGVPRISILKGEGLGI